ncbi:MAG: DUF3943 domain-containing protein [Myxococcales bacterium]|nr:DUF3943 domain-containing protein [Myxococcales bacterium]MCB9576037.1 DUF3943 domain-containing protein [Polyangiaceae bacterium]
MIVRAAAVVVTLLVARSAAAEPPRWDVPTTHAVGLMTTMRTAEIFIWPEPFARFDPGGYERAFSQPPKWDTSQPAFEWDGDPWAVNVLGHGLFGSELYLRVRSCRHGVVPALAFTTLGSAVWEYGFEANGARPSGLDLVYTPAAGLVLGEARLLGWRAAKGISDPTWRGILSTLFDPFGELERGLGARC